jgi:AcrR family transcriptional regulator
MVQKARKAANSTSARVARRSKGKTGRTNNAEASRAEILAAATREFSEKGLSGARVDEIAERTQINKRMIYY